MRRLLGVIAALAIALSAPLGAGAEVTDEDLTRAKQQKQALQRELNAAADAYSQALSVLDTTRTDILKKTDDIAAARSRYDGQKLIVSRRAVAAYKGERSGEVGAVLGSRTMNDLVDRAAYLERQSAKDTEIVERLRILGGDLRTEQAQLEKLEASQQRAVVRMETLQKDLENKLTSAQLDEDRLIALRVEEDAARQRAAAAEGARRAVEEEERRRQAALAPIAPVPGAPPTTARAGGPPSTSAPLPTEGDTGGPPVGTPRPVVAPVAINGIVCPVPGGAISNNYGDPRSGHSHQGNDIFAAPGTPLLATVSGTVMLQEGGAGGLMVYLYSGSDYYFYAHLESFSVSDGQSVGAGQVVGIVGMSGNAVGDLPHLHFEIHPGGGVAIDPYPTLSASC